MLSFLLVPFLACVILVFIHGYFGQHVVSRKVIFVDLALAQLAALGISFAHLMNIDEQSLWAYGISFLFTLIGAAIFSLTRSRSDRIPHEAIIGMTFVAATALATLVMSHLPQGAEHLEHILNGSILFLTPKGLKHAALIYAGVGAAAALLHKRFAKNSENFHQEPDWPQRFWDMAFYALFGVVVTSSVRIAGVLLVFTFLIVPSLFSLLFAQSFGRRFLIGSTMGITAAALGLGLSVRYDWPSSAAIIITMTAIFTVAGIQSALTCCVTK